MSYDTWRTDSGRETAAWELEDEPPTVCPVCLGSGETRQQISDDFDTIAPCAECGGRGYYTEAV